ncbi:Protein-tyrosine phosphatase [Ancylostoma duodenale]|uniref:Protein-tyrosine phosphatase n=1 Tax=Ancylostoma duodenale TaxID=51022 RepID=A0A0C2FZ32_9BILA|nr:Protein-tyrosine phosphatase [Ancylostoma duodenale]
MTTRVKRGGVKTARARRRTRITEATYEEPEGPAVPVPEPKGKKAATTARKAGANVSAEVEKHLDNFVETFTTLGWFSSYSNEYYNLPSSNTVLSGVEGLRKQFKEGLAAYRAPEDKYKFTAFEAHPDKNRYLDVVCLDETRVRLTLNVPPSTDYIHANWVKFEGHDKVFIATQSPLDNTIEDFWRMVFQEGCPHIVNLTKVANMPN